MKPRIWIKKQITGYLASDKRRRLKHFAGRLTRRGAPTVHYFHQVDDPYSHLAAQKLEALEHTYRVRFQYHLASSPTPEEQGDSERFRGWAIRDARSVASFYGTSLPGQVDTPDDASVRHAEHQLAKFVDSQDFIREAIAVGERLWRGETIAGSEQGRTPAVIEGSRLRHALGHWLGATFFFEGEWYWGVDRLHHLEVRLAALGLSNSPGLICVPRPLAEPVGTRDASDVTLTYFPSLRSPYTAISFDRTIELARRTGVKLILKPVMPMMMRGIPAPRMKQFYIISDTRREADYYGERFGPIVDPFGEPVKRAFSLLPYLQAIGRETEFCSQYVRAAWAEGLDITTDQGLREVVRRAGGDWREAARQMDNDTWLPMLEQNVAEMLAAGLWGVPSFKVSGGTDDKDYCCWGQDRLWRVETEIVRRAK